MELCHTFQPSTMSSSCVTGYMQDICRICHCEGDPDFPLISPCYCSGSMGYVHQSCLQQWIKSSGNRFCELCKFHFIIHTKIKPFRKWEKLAISPVEQREGLCFITCLAFMVTCVVCSLHKLISERDVLVWWASLIFDVIGFIAAFVVMYIKSKKCMQLFQKWRAYNSIIYVQNAPEERTTEQHQQMVVLPDATQLTTNATASESNCLLPHECAFHSCQSCCRSTNMSDNCSSKCVNVDDIKSISGEKPTVEMGSNTTSMKDSIQESTENLNHSLSDVVVIPTTNGPIISNDEQNSYFLCKQPQHTTS